MPIEIFALAFVLGTALTRVVRQTLPAISQPAAVVGPGLVRVSVPAEQAPLSKILAFELLIFASAAVPAGLQSSGAIWSDFPALFSSSISASLALTYGGIFLLRNPRVLQTSSPAHLMLTTIARICCALLCLSVAYALVIDAFTILRFAF